MATTNVKRKRVVLTITDKVKILELLDKSISYTIIAERFRIGKSTIGDIKKNREKFFKFKSEMIDMGMTRSAKVMKLSDDNKLDQIYGSGRRVWKGCLLVALCSVRRL